MKPAKRFSTLAMLVAAGAFPAAAAEPLAIDQAVRIALESHPALEAAQAGLGEAKAGVRLAKAGRLPRIRFTESYLRSNNPVFAFSSLLNQRRFTQEDFDVDGLNNPGARQNSQSLLRVEQTLFDFGTLGHGVVAARIESRRSVEAERSAEAGVIFGVVRAYFGAALAAESLTVAEESMKTAQADQKRAQALFEAGMATRADVLSIEAHLAAVEEQRIRAKSEAEVAQAALADAMGVELERTFTLTSSLDRPPAAVDSLQRYTALSIENRPELRGSALGSDAAAARRKQAESARWPRLVAQGAIQADRGTFAAQAGGSWLVGASLEWDAWKGSENRARITAARFAEQHAEADLRRARSAVALEVRRAYSAHKSAAERVRTAEVAQGRAAESLRIIQHRYEAGLEDVTELIRGETAVIEARFRRLAALYDQRVARVALDRAAGVLTPSSEALQ